MTDKPSRLLRCPLPEKWREIPPEEEYYQQPEIFRILTECADEFDSWRERIEPLLVALVEAGERPNHYECEDGWFSCPKHPGYFGTDSTSFCTCGKDEWDAAKKAFLEGVEK